VSAHSVLDKDTRKNAEGIRSGEKFERQRGTHHDAEEKHERNRAWYGKWKYSPLYQKRVANGNLEGREMHGVCKKNMMKLLLR